jgi:hypothetical protein
MQQGDVDVLGVAPGQRRSRGDVGGVPGSLIGAKIAAVSEAYDLREIESSRFVSTTEYLAGRWRSATTKQPGARAALYLRVSTADQKPDLQYDGLRGYVERADLNVVRDYCDVAVSGRREGRPPAQCPDGNRARNREIDCVLVWKFDRFARSTRHPLIALEEFNHLGVLRQRPRSGRYRQPRGPGDVHHHRRHGRA